jgi:hypothetical protein
MRSATGKHRRDADGAGHRDSYAPPTPKDVRAGTYEHLASAVIRTVGFESSPPASWRKTMIDNDNFLKSGG